MRAGSDATPPPPVRWATTPPGRDVSGRDTTLRDGRVVAPPTSAAAQVDFLVTDLRLDSRQQRLDRGC